MSAEAVFTPSLGVCDPTLTVRRCHNRLWALPGAKTFATGGGEKSKRRQHMFSHYKQEVSKYTKKDAIIALVFFIYACIVTYVFSFLSTLPNAPFGDTVSTIMSAVLITGPLFCIIIFKKQGLSSIGLHTKNLWPALRIGLILSAVILMFNAILPWLLSDWDFRPTNLIMQFLFFSVVTSLVEDTLYTGFIQTRIYGLIKNDFVAVLVTAALFALSHIPTHVAFGGVAGLSVIISFSMIFWIIMHCIWNLIFRRHFSLFPIMMTHIVWNFGNTGIFDRPGTHGHWISTYNLYVFLLAVIIWLVISRRNARKTSAKQA